VHAVNTSTDIQNPTYRTLPQAPIALTAHHMQTLALSGSDKFRTRPLTPGGNMSFFFKEMPFDAIPKGAAPGDLLTGSVTYLRKDSAMPGR